MRRYQAKRPGSSEGSGDGSSPGGGWDELDLAANEADVFLLGHWKNYDELEENLTIDELNLTLDAMRRREFERMKFEASLHKGVDLGNMNAESDEERFDRIKREAQAEILAGGDSEKAKNIEEQLAFAEVGIAVIEE